MSNSSLRNLNLSPPAFGPGFFLTFLYYFSGSTLLASLMAAQSLQIPYGTGIPMQMGAAIGLFGGTIGGYFNRSATLEVPFNGKRKTFLERLNPILDEMGYRRADTVEDETGEIWVYQRSLLRQMFSGKIYVQLQANAATITSRAVHLRGLRRQLQH
ncbi:MAG: hypothetical protein AAGF66_10960 [Cyanobacteria bacterium P01_H01_bin.119]